MLVVLSRLSGRSGHVPRGAVRLSARLLQLHLLRASVRAGVNNLPRVALHLLRRTRTAQLADPQHPGRLLVGNRHHDDGHRQATWNFMAFC